MRNFHHLRDCLADRMMAIEQLASLTHSSLSSQVCVSRRFITLCQMSKAQSIPLLFVPGLPTSSLSLEIVNSLILYSLPIGIPWRRMMTSKCSKVVFGSLSFPAWAIPSCLRGFAGYVVIQASLKLARAFGRRPPARREFALPFIYMIGYHVSCKTRSKSHSSALLTLCCHCHSGC